MLNRSYWSLEGGIRCGTYLLGGHRDATEIGRQLGSALSYRNSSMSRWGSITTAARSCSINGRKLMLRDATTAIVTHPMDLEGV